MTPRIAITGIGLVTALGATREESWRRMLAGECGIRAGDRLRHRGLPQPRRRAKSTWPPSTPALTPLERRRRSRGDRIGVHAAAEALADAGPARQRRRPIARRRLPRRRHRRSAAQRGLLPHLDHGGPRAHAPSDVWNHFPSTPVDAIAARFGLEGPRGCVVGGVLVEHDRDRPRRRGDPLRAAPTRCWPAAPTRSSRLTFSGFNLLRLMDPAPCRPFDRSRAGMNIGEGAGILVLERSRSRAPPRRARSTPSWPATASACEAFHPTAPEPEGRPVAADRRRSRSTTRGINADEVDHINAHGTATPQNDAAEARGFRRVFGERAQPDSGHVDQVDDRPLPRRGRRGRGRGARADRRARRDPADDPSRRDRRRLRRRRRRQPGARAAGARARCRRRSASAATTRRSCCRRVRRAEPTARTSSQHRPTSSERIDVSRARRRDEPRERRMAARLAIACHVRAKPRAARSSPSSRARSASSSIIGSPRLACRRRRNSTSTTFARRGRVDAPASAGSQARRNCCMRACSTKKRRISGSIEAMNSGWRSRRWKNSSAVMRPVAGVVPRDLRRHHLRVAHDRVLAVVEPDERVEQAQVGRVERLGARRDVLAARVADDEIGDVVVAHRDEVGSRRVERIGEDTRFADQRPAVGREDPRAAVREVLQREEVLELAGVRLRRPSAHCGSNSRSQSIARSKRLIRVNGCMSPSATMPKLLLPDPSGISQTQ